MHGGKILGLVDTLTAMTYHSHPIVDYQSLMADGVQLIDVREPVEVAEGTLPESINIPVGEVEGRVGELDPSRPVVLFCRSGGRSGSAAQFLVASGFSNVTNLEGGMLAWDAHHSQR